MIHIGHVIYLKKVKVQELRQDILENGLKFLALVSGRIEKDTPAFRDKSEEKLFEGLIKIIEQEDAPVKFDYKGESPQERIEAIMQAIADGKLTPKQGETIMATYRTSFEMTELSEVKELLLNQQQGQIEQQTPHVEVVNYDDWQNSKASKSGD